MADRKALRPVIMAIVAVGLVVRVVSRTGRERSGRAGSRTQETDGAITARTRLARGSDLARLGGRASGDYALLRARQVFANAERRDELQSDFELRTAADVAQALGNMKGAMMKLGQMASYLDQSLPEPVRVALTQLQADAPPMSADLAASVILAELGGPPGEIFLEWDPQPIASASIGQVHRAITHDGEAVAVKVQYPGVDDAIRSDLANADLIFGGLARVFPGLDPGPIAEELRVRLGEELDYRIEASNQQLFYRYFDGHPYIDVPAVKPELSTTRVLTSELAVGATFAEAQEWDQEQRDRVAETIYRFAFGSIYRLRAFNGDPHPGNYLFGPDGRVTFLDFGLVRRFSDSDVEIYEQLIQSMVLDPDPRMFRSTVEQAGLLRPAPELTDDQVADYFRHFYAFVLEDRSYAIDNDYATESVRRVFDANGPHREVIAAANVPPSFVILQRINLGLYAIFGGLSAQANWRRIAEELWPFVDGSPSTAMGREIAATWHPPPIEELR